MLEYLVNPTTFIVNAVDDAVLMVSIVISKTRTRSEKKNVKFCWHEGKRRTTEIKFVCVCECLLVFSSQFSVFNEWLDFVQSSNAV